MISYREAARQSALLGNSHMPQQALRLAASRGMRAKRMQQARAASSVPLQMTLRLICYSIRAHKAFVIGHHES